MQFRPVNQHDPIIPGLTSMLLERSNVAIEGVATGHTIDIEGESMGVYMITDKMIADNEIKEVTSPIWFKNGHEPTDDGLFSPIIFGETAKEQSRKRGYINLKRKFFHPHIYKTLCKLQRKKIEQISLGQGSWVVTADGQLECITDENDKRYNEDNTGIAWLVENFRKIKFKETESDSTKTKIRMLNNLSDDEIFITKYVVIPILYRGYTETNGKLSMPDVNYWYNEIIMNTASYDTEVLSVSKHMTLYNIQKTLVKLYEFGQSLLEKKKGALQKTIMGKAVDFGGRGVISVPSLNNCDTPKDCIVDIKHSGIPLAYCLQMGYPFIIKWLTEFFEETFRNKQVIPQYIKDENGEYKLVYEEIEDQTEVFTKDFLDRKIEMYRKTYGAERFDTVKIKRKDGTWADMYFPGKGYTENPNDPRSNTIGNRPMTWTDIFYIAAVETLSDKHCHITRYPLEDYFGIFPSRVAVLSTIKTAPVIINGKVYPHYPVIDLSLSSREIGTQFIDTFTISNLYLDAIGGDYDGDTVSAKILFTIEANEEAEAQLNNIRHYVSIQGDLVRILGNETFLTFYNMTKRE